MDGLIEHDALSDVTDLFEPLGSSAEDRASASQERPVDSALFAREVITGFARLGGRAVGIVANQPKVKGGVLFVDSSDKAARFIWLCNAYNIPLVYLADVSGFMVGTKVEAERWIAAEPSPFGSARRAAPSARFASSAMATTSSSRSSGRPIMK